MNSGASCDSIFELMNNGTIPLGRIRELKEFPSKMKGGYYRDLAAEFSTSDAENKATDEKFIDKVLVLPMQMSISRAPTGFRINETTLWCDLDLDLILILDQVENENHNTTHEASFFHDADERDDNFQMILTALPSELKSNIDGANKNEPESKNENEEMLQKTQELLDQHRHQQELES